MYALILAVGEGPNNPILPVVNEIIWGSIAFFLLLIVMTKFAYPAMRKAMDDRTARIQGDLDAAEQAKDEAAQLKADYDAKLSEAKAEAVGIIDAAREEAEVVRAERIGAIDGEIAELRAQADADIEAAKERAMADMRSQVTALAVGAAERIVEQSLDAEAQTQLVNNFIDRVGSES
ncbi:MAG: F0F1 ATP synthase subunit B [Actinobacteria bacterium]|nr:F0F1 ATP synthase subunit B [Actinomycetota bacterium]